MSDSTDSLNGPAFRQAAANLLATAGYRTDFALHPLSGGGNNRTFRVDAGTTSLLLKAYFRHPQDPRDRLGTEFAFSTFAWQNGVRALPQPLACDCAHGLGLYEFVPGRRLLPHEVDGPAVRQAVAFFNAVNQVKHLPQAQELPPGSEACFTLAGHLHCVERRLQRLKELDDPSALGREAGQFIQHELTPAWHAVAAVVRAGIARLGLHEELAPEDRCLSPSDFGFHNALLEANGRLRFLDFEYAGWDDPAKMVCDFFCQPAVPVPADCHDLVLDAVAGMVRERIGLLRPVYQLKWCCILLNDFLPLGGQRRSFAGGAAAREERRDTQLRKARQVLHQFLSSPSQPFAA